MNQLGPGDLVHAALIADVTISSDGVNEHRRRVKGKF